jgi:hypothetical protein
VKKTSRKMMVDRVYEESRLLEDKGPKTWMERPMGIVRGVGVPEAAVAVKVKRYAGKILNLLKLAVMICKGGTLGF